MNSRCGVPLVAWVITLLFLTTIISINVSGTSDVDYVIGITDAADDSVSMYGNDATTLEDADITEVTSRNDDGIIILTLKVSGTININQPGYSNTYAFNIDIDGDDENDWFITTSTVNAHTGYDTMIQDDEEKHSFELSNASGQGTNSLTVRFPITTISDLETVSSWGLYASAKVENSDAVAMATDLAPDDGFSDDEILDSDGDKIPDDADTDNDNDGMVDAWEVKYGLDPYDASDAVADNDGDTFYNFEEYNYETDPLDPDSHPDMCICDHGIDPMLVLPTDTSISVKITSALYSIKTEGDRVHIDIQVE